MSRSTGTVTPRPPAGPRARLARLEAEMGDRIAGSVDVLEVAVVLESAGVSDRIAIQVYGVNDVIELAHWLRGSVQPELNAPASDPLDWYGPYWLCVIRGCAYVFAGIMSMAVAGLVSDPLAGTVMLGSSVVATALMAWLSYLGHTIALRAPSDHRGASLSVMFRTGMIGALATGVLVGLFTSPWVGLLAVLPLVYAVVAVILLILDRHLMFGLALAPGGVAAVCQMLWPSGPVSGEVAMTVAALGMAVIVAVTAFLVRRRGLAVDGAGRIDLLSALPFALAGIALALLVAGSLVAFSRVGGALDARSREWFILALPFFVPLGLADFGVVAVRRRVRDLLSRSSSRSELVRSAHRGLLWLWCAHAVVGGGMVLTAPRLLDGDAIDQRLALTVSLGFFALGAVLVASLLAEPGGSLTPVVHTVTAGALVATGIIGRGHHQFAVAATATAVIVVAMLLLSGAEWRRIGRLATHRWSV